jgi:hypothetical protein
VRFVEDVLPEVEAVSALEKVHEIEGWLRAEGMFE